MAKDNSELSSRSKEEKWADWLQAIGSIVTSGILIVLTHQQMKSAENHQKHEVMSDYVKQMTELRIEHGLSPLFLKQVAQDSKDQEKRDQVIAAAQDNTLNAARQLDGKHRGYLLKFLYDTKLIGECPPRDGKTGKIDPTRCQKGFVPFAGINLDRTAPEDRLSLSGVELREASLKGAKLQGITLIKADLSKANLTRTDLTGAVLEGARLSSATLNDAFLAKANMNNVNLVGAFLKRATLTETNLRGADLRCTNLISAKLQKAELKGAIYSDKTTFPENFDASEQGMLKFISDKKEEQCNPDLDRKVIQAKLEKSLRQKVSRGQYNWLSLCRYAQRCSRDR